MGNYYETFNPPFFLTKWSSFSPLKINQNSYARDDHDIITDLNARLAMISHNLHGIACEEVSVSSSNQTVTLSGTVANTQIKRFIENVASQTFGIRDVKNLLEIPRAGASHLNPQPNIETPTANINHLEINISEIELPN